MSTTDLKPCPFCGSPAWIMRWPIIGGDLYKACCDNRDCGAETAAKESREKAAKAWNNRAKGAR